jgi:hypothetical protein
MLSTLPSDKSSTTIRNHILTFLKILCMVCVTYYLTQHVVLYTFRYDFVITNVNMSYHNLIINEKEKNITALYYRHSTLSRNSSYPFTSGDTFREFADYIYDETRKDNLKSVKFGDIVFVKADRFSQFFAEPYKSINNSFVLVTHNSDLSAPADFLNKLANEKILAWYASNADRRISKLFPIPIGLANTYWPSGNLSIITYAFKNYRKPWANRTTLLYVSFTVKNNKAERHAALSQASKLQNVTISETKITFEAYLKQIGDAKFVLSPPGNGVDCHRTWEALLMGAVPIVRSSAFDSLFDGLPVAILNDWSKLTQHFLLSYNLSSDDKMIPASLYARYWLEKLQKHRHIPLKS